MSAHSPVKRHSSSTGSPSKEVFEDQTKDIPQDAKSDVQKEIKDRKEEVEKLRNRGFVPKMKLVLESALGGKKSQQREEIEKELKGLGERKLDKPPTDRSSSATKASSLPTFQSASSSTTQAQKDLSASSSSPSSMHSSPSGTENQPFSSSSSSSSSTPSSTSSPDQKLSTDPSPSSMPSSPPGTGSNGNININVTHIHIDGSGGVGGPKGEEKKSEETTKTAEKSPESPAKAELSASPSDVSSSGKPEALKRHPVIDNLRDVETLQSAMASLRGVGKTESAPVGTKEDHLELFQRFAEKLGFPAGTPKAEPGAKLDFSDPHVQTFFKQCGLSNSEIRGMELNGRIEVMADGTFNIHVEGNCGEALKKVLTEFKKIADESGLAQKIGLDIDPDVAIMTDADLEALKEGGWISHTKTKDKEGKEQKVTVQVTPNTVTFKIGDKASYNFNSAAVFGYADKGEPIDKDWKKKIENTVTKKTYELGLFSGSTLTGSTQDKTDENLGDLMGALDRYLALRVDDKRDKVRLDTAGKESSKTPSSSSGPSSASSAPSMTSSSSTNLQTKAS
ncbi:MAG: hypothetical protein LBR62_01120, partial [Puniceicoccales bacterium]|nr:hypothetical protein [Puniceicoccales bacterium]